MTAFDSTHVSFFSLTHAQVLDGATSFLTAGLLVATPDDLDLYSVSNASVTPNTSDFSNEGDDTVTEYRQWLTDADIAIEQGFLSMATWARITGQQLSSTLSGPTGARRILGMDLWHEDSLNVKPFPMLLRMPCADEDGTPGTGLFGLYKVTPGAMTINGPQYKQGTKFGMTGKVLPSRKDELGNVFADGKRRVGRILAFWPS
jgi:hypothetical protein